MGEVPLFSPMREWAVGPTLLLVGGPSKVNTPGDAGALPPSPVKADAAAPLSPGVATSDESRGEDATPAPPPPLLMLLLAWRAKAAHPDGVEGTRAATAAAAVAAARFPLLRRDGPLPPLLDVLHVLPPLLKSLASSSLVVVCVLSCVVRLAEPPLDDPGALPPLLPPPPDWDGDPPLEPGAEDEPGDPDNTAVIAAEGEGETPRPAAGGVAAPPIPIASRAIEECDED